ncbi:hypothetical protein M0L20_28605 [Spirosoma sp. RP8]|uniref:Uncharacterized protein n=1 Tax=Spirosoma liriopis TaxID=2937440 RepID=A0ABT0HUJ1_9BACT|nr:hypothetical protein [Spirosoma liriopis]MCK8495861.1 hypothetical protein [Spirosoma liriopis]
MLTNQKRYELLEALPVYGPMYIPVTRNKSGSQDFYSQGFVVRFFKSDGSTWVANFKPGMTPYNAVFDFPDTDIIIVIAGGSGYTMNRDHITPIDTFGYGIRMAVRADSQQVAAADYTDIKVINAKGQVWVSRQISWDGIQDLRVEGEIVSGKNYDPMGEEWVDFTLNLTTRQVKGGSYARYDL